jgi:long-chain fatty acid transport protein
VRPSTGAAAGLGLAAVLLGMTRPAAAAGLYFSDGGVRPLSRGGAFVAGADDLGAMQYNPAGLADAGTSLMLDASWLNFTSDFTRQTQVTDASGATHVVGSPTVHGSAPVEPIPTIGVSVALGQEKRWTLAAGAFAPYAAIASYPQTVNGQPAPQRYSLVSLNGSLLAIPGLYVAYKPVDWLRIGAGVQALVGSFQATESFSASPQNKLLASPEDPSYDAFGQLKAGPIFAPSANAGITVVPDEHVRIGLSYQLPYVVNAPATVNLKLPSAAVFDNAYQQGDNARIRFELPPVLRAGIEGRVKIARRDLLRVEVSYKREFWTVEHAIEVEPTNVKLYDITAFPNPYAVNKIVFPRNFENTNEVALGGEFSFPAGRYAFDLRAGANYEQSAIPNAYLSPLTIDLARITVGTGASFHLNDHLRLDVVYAHVFGMSTTVDPAVAAIQKVNPVQGNPAPSETINGGMYSARADVLGVGFNYKF